MVICKCKRPITVVVRDIGKARQDNRKRMKCVTCGAKWTRVEK